MRTPRAFRHDATWWTRLAAVAASVFAVALSNAGAMTPAEFDQFRVRWEQEYFEVFPLRATRETIAPLRKRYLESFDFSEALPTQIAYVQERIMLRVEWPDGVLIDRTNEAIERLGEFTDDETIQGAAALATLAYLHPDESPEDVAARVALFRRAFEHPQIVRVVAEGETLKVLYRLPAIAFGTAAYADLTDQALDFAEGVAALEEIHPRAAINLLDFYEDLRNLLKASDPERLESFRRQFLRLATDAQRQEDSDLIPEERTFLNDTIVALELAPVTEHLEGSLAPELDFLWSTDPDLTSLADLRGKVVVLDFWATWCAPCIAAFPKIRDLQTRYEGLPVAIVGVTSEHGSVITRGRGVVLAESQQHEFDLLGQYAAEMDMTWTVAFSTQNVFNPQYGVSGIPHTVLINPAGVIRRSKIGIHNVAAMTEAIDELLRESGLPVPD